MIKKIKLTLFNLFLTITLIVAQSNIIKGVGDLYVIHNDDNIGIRVIAAQADGSVLDKTFHTLPNDLTFKYIAADKNTDIEFEFQLRERVKNDWYMNPAKKTLVVSDLHGRLDAYVAFLKGNKVIDNNLNWIYGDNHLIMVGDMLDRGRDDIGIAWLTYKLEKEAQDAGGCLQFIIGNHEDLALKDDLRYIHQDHFQFSLKAEIPYAHLLGDNTELGKWLRDSYWIIYSGKNLFVHAGLSIEMRSSSYKVGEINELGARFTGFTTKEKKELHSRNEKLFGSDGPIWYRGLSRDDERYNPITSEDLDKILTYYDANKIIVGHTEVDEVEWRHDGRVIAVNVRHYNNLGENRTAGLLIEDEKYYSVNYTGNKVLLGE